jgi:hypothetical protein
VSTHGLGALRAFHWLCLGVALSTAACAGSGAARREPAAPLTPAQARLFDDGVDLIENPEALQGQWREDWQREVEQRLQQAEMVVVGRVRSVGTDVDLQRRVSFRVDLEVQRVVKGEQVPDELSLIASPGAVGYASLERQREQMLQRELVAFVRRAADGGAERLHFHLSAPSPALMRYLDAHDTSAKSDTVKVIEHTQ